MNALTHVRGQEERKFRQLARFIRDGIDQDAAIRAIERVPHSYWPDDELEPLTGSVVAYVREIPPERRTSPEALEALQLGDRLASRLPPESARAIRAKLGKLGVRVIHIGTRPHQMLYDQDSFAVEVGESVEFFFENSDIMPHNFVVTKPGALEEIGRASEAMATDADALRKQYVPESEKVLLASRLLQPRESQKLP